MSIIDKQGRRKELFELYLSRTDRIHNWDLVDLGAPYVLGRCLFDKPRNVLHELARSEDVWERRSAIVTTSYIIKQGDVSDTFQIAEVLLDDLIHKATGEWLRAAGKKDRQKLMGFLDECAATMPRCAIEHLDKERRTLIT